MGGIVGIISQKDIVAQLVDTMGRISYHVEDSCGLATLNLSTIEIRKDIGYLQEVSHRRGFNQATGCLGIAHVGKLLEGRISRKNAQPHLSCNGKFVVVNDGVISNSQRLRANLETTGRHFFFSDTSAEVFGHVMEETYWVSHSAEEAFAQALQQIEGDFAVAVISNCESPRIFCAHKNRFLLIGTENQRTVMTSCNNAFRFDSTPFSLGPGEYAVLSVGGFSVATVSLRNQHFNPDSALLP